MGIMDDIDRIRAFNRLYTGRFGLLSRSYLRSGFGVSEARLLYDLGESPGAEARALARALGLDEGQVSRTVAAFVKRGLVERGTDEGDARRRPLRLTAAGQEFLAGLRAQSRAAVAESLSGLPDGRGARLAALLGRATRLMIAPDAVDLRSLQPGDAGWVIGRHGALYAQDEGYDQRFESLVAGIVAGFLDRGDTGRERGWIAVDATGDRLGCIFCMAEGPDQPDIARLRLFLLEPDARGTGLAQRMIETCLGFARDAGYRHIRLWTHESHRAAGRLYERNGFTLTSRTEGEAFGQKVVDQTWERPLTDG